jgi:hypothetical protein
VRLRLLYSAALILVGLVLGVALFAPNLLVAVLILLVTLGALGCALWILSQFPNPFR